LGKQGINHRSNILIRTRSKDMRKEKQTSHRPQGQKEKTKHFAGEDEGNGSKMRGGGWSLKVSIEEHAGLPIRFNRSARKRIGNTEIKISLVG